MKNWFILIMALTAVSVVFVIALFVGCAERHEIAELTAGTTSTTSGGIAVDPIVDVTTTTSTTTSTTSTTLYSARGVLDTSFSGDGVVVHSSASTDLGSGVAIDSSGTIYVTGCNNGEIAFWSYNDNGALNTGFSGDGRQTYPGGGGNVGKSIVLDSAGRLVVAGYHSRNSILLRYNTNGTIDTGFGDEGVKVYEGAGFDYWNNLVTDTSNNYFTVGTVEKDIIVAKYSSDGDPVAGFADEGFWHYRTGAYNDAGWDLALDGDDKIVVTGFIDDTDNGSSAEQDIGVIRLTSSGSPDNTFSADGKEIINYADLADRGRGVVIDDLGRVLIGAHVHNGSNYDFAVYRLTAAGELDTTFGPDGNGRAVVDYNASNDEVEGICLDKSGKILLAGMTDGRTDDRDMLVARFSQDGILDESFGEEGFYKYDSGRYDSFGSVTLDNLGRIVIASSSYDYHYVEARDRMEINIDSYDMFLLRLK